MGGEGAGWSRTKRQLRSSCTDVIDEVHAKHPGCLLDKWKNVLRFALLERSLGLDSECSVYEVG